MRFGAALFCPGVNRTFSLAAICGDDEAGECSPAAWVEGDLLEGDLLEGDLLEVLAGLFVGWGCDVGAEEDDGLALDAPCEPAG